MKDLQIHDERVEAAPTSEIHSGEAPHRRGWLNAVAASRWFSCWRASLLAALFPQFAHDAINDGVGNTVG